MNKQETNSNNSSDNLHQNLSPEETDMFPSVDAEMEQLRASAVEEGVFSGQRFMRDALNGIKDVMGSDLFRIIIFVLLMSIHNPYSGSWNSRTGSDDTMHITTIYNTLKSPNVNSNNSKYKETLIKKEVLLPEEQSSKYLSYSTRVKNTLLSPISPPEFVANLDTDNNTILENTEILNLNNINNRNDKNIINAFTINRRNGNWIPIDDKEAKTDYYLNYNVVTHSAFGLYKESSVSQSEIITIKPFKGKEIKLLSSFINGYLKTNMHIEKDMVVYISSNGIVSTNNCNIEFRPEGWSNKLHDAACEPFLEQFNVGALLFRIGNDDNWKPYTASQTNIIAEKDGVLEFMINLKSSGENLIKGSYVLGVSTGQLTINN